MGGNNVFGRLGSILLVFCPVMETIRIFERRILRKIFGPIQNEKSWRIRMNYELNELIKNADIVRFIKAQE